MDLPIMENNTKTQKSKSNQSSAKTTVKMYKNYQDFMYKHQLGSDDTREITNTRITGGKYHIPDEEYQTFLNLYFNDIVSKKANEFLTEKQREKDGPIVVDVDLRYDISVTEKLYKKTHIDDLIYLYLKELKKIYQFENQLKFSVFVFEKKNVNRLIDKNITKDGIHLIFGIQCDHTTQSILRERIVDKIQEVWGDLEIKNTWEDVFDKGISEGRVNWQLYGSRKPDHEDYKLTQHYEFQYDISDDELLKTELHVKNFNFQKDLNKLSVRYNEHPCLNFNAEFISIHENHKMKEKTKSTNVKIKNLIKISGGRNQNSVENILNIKNKDDLDQAVEEFLENISPTDYELKEAYDYTMALPESYYGVGSYNKWIKVGLALNNVSKNLLIVWIAFSSKYEHFDYGFINDMCNKWASFQSRNSEGLTFRSIMYWAKSEAGEQYEKIRASSIDFYIEQTLKSITSNSDGKSSKCIGCGDSDIAFILKQLYKDQFICASIKSDKWYRFSKHRWVEDECGTTLRRHISEELRAIYRNKLDELLMKLTDRDIDEETKKKIELRVGVLSEIVTKLARTTDKDHILKEAKELFFDKDIKFLDLLDSNPYLLCFENGVLDIKENIFRPGRAEDYISKSTNINYKKIDKVRDDKIINEINDFMAKLFPSEQLRKYMWEHLASTLVGTIPNQTFNMYIGGGENGKSVLTDLMSQVLGDYKCDAPLSLITQSRQKLGQANPDVVALKGVRYAVMQEPSKGDKINDGAMKELTSGVEPLKGRNLFCMPISFIPQFKLVICSNNFLEIKTQDHGAWRRIRVVDFVSLFTDNPVQGDKEKPHQFKIDRKLKEKFPEWKEVFIALLSEIVLRTQGNVEDCAMVMESSKKYREREDHIAEFMRDKIVMDVNGKITKTEATNEFNIWYSSTYGKGAPSTKEVHEYLDKKLGKFSSKHGAWVGARIRYEHDEIVDIDESDDDNDITEDDL